ncbi:hypothetical protein [Maridesulfovibrio sp.]|uniref:hypothetical protein n=1 Tax=Maridesulfovibrio sp. TaxID=2795000 RepID=UPI003BAB550D
MKKLVFGVRNEESGSGEIFHPESGKTVAFGVDLEGLVEYGGPIPVDELVKLRTAGFGAGDIVRMHNEGVLG